MRDYLQTMVTTLQAVMPMSQPGAFHCVTKTVPEWPDPPSACWWCTCCGGSGLVHETRVTHGIFFHFTYFSPRSFLAVLLLSSFTQCPMAPWPIKGSISVSVTIDRFVIPHSYPRSTFLNSRTPVRSRIFEIPAMMGVPRPKQWGIPRDVTVGFFPPTPPYIPGGTFPLSKADKASLILSPAKESSGFWIVLSSYRENFLNYC